jgi:hypothetical protein
MLADKMILTLAWIAAILLLLIFTPRDKIREAMIIFMFKQVLTWMFGLLVVELRMIEYPIRELPYATRASFGFEYFIYPATCVVFILRFPEDGSWLKKLGWYLFWPTWMTIVETILERHTNLVHFIHWTWYWTWITLLMTFYIARVYYKWFLKKGIPSSHA